MRDENKMTVREKKQHDRRRFVALRLLDMSQAQWGGEFCIEWYRVQGGFNRTRTSKDLTELQLIARILELQKLAGAETILLIDFPPERQTFAMKRVGAWKLQKFIDFKKHMARLYL